MGYYSTWGSVRGCCHHAHRTIRMAARCVAADQATCARHGGYSDRSVVAIDSARDLASYDTRLGPGRDLTEAEHHVIAHYEEV